MGRKVVSPKATQPCGSGGMLPKKIFKFRVSEILFQRFRRDIFSKSIRSIGLTNDQKYLQNSVYNIRIIRESCGNRLCVTGSHLG